MTVSREIGHLHIYAPIQRKYNTKKIALIVARPFKLINELPAKASLPQTSCTVQDELPKIHNLNFSKFG